MVATGPRRWRRPTGGRRRADSAPPLRSRIGYGCRAPTGHACPRTDLPGTPYVGRRYTDCRLVHPPVAAGRLHTPFQSTDLPDSAATGRSRCPCRWIPGGDPAPPRPRAGAAGVRVDGREGREDRAGGGAGARCARRSGAIERGAAVARPAAGSCRARGRRGDETAGEGEGVAWRLEAVALGEGGAMKRPERGRESHGG